MMSVDILQTGSTNEENNLRDNLEAEREAVMDFLFTIVDKVSRVLAEGLLQISHCQVYLLCLQYMSYRQFDSPAPC